MGPNAPGTRRKHAQPLSFRDNLIGSQIVESSESSLDLNAQNMWFSGALGQTEWPFGEARTLDFELHKVDFADVY
jgi:hypothetical protein